MSFLVVLETLAHVSYKGTQERGKGGIPKVETSKYSEIIAPHPPCRIDDSEVYKDHARESIFQPYRAQHEISLAAEEPRASIR